MPRRHLPIALAAILAVLLLLPGSALAQATAPAGGETDLAALALVPADLARAGVPGFLHAGAFVEPVTGEARNLAGYWGQGIVASDVADRLRADGWQRKYVSTLQQPGSSDPNQPPRLVRSYITSYADAAGAAAGFAYVNDGPAPPSEQTVTNARSFGAQSKVTRDRGTSADGRPFRSLDLTFQQGNLVAGVTIIAYPSRTFADPDLATGESLAAVLAARVAAPPAADLGPQVLRFQGEPPAVTTYDDAYYRLAGADVPLTDETPAVAAARTHSYGDAQDVYQLWQGVQTGDGASLLFGETLMRFPSAPAATAWLGNLAFELGHNPYYGDLQPLSAPPLGDAVAAFAYTPPAGRARSAILVATRVGATVGRVQLVPQGRLGTISLEAAVALATAQVACLNAGACQQPATLPPDLAGAATPAASPQALGISR